MRSHLPDYESVAELSRASSWVYRARRTADGQSVIVKLAADGPGRHASVVRLKREYELLSSIAVDGVVKAHGIFVRAGQWYMELEDFGGISLAACLAENELSLADKMTLALAITGAIGDLHAAGILHKDINPHNIVCRLDQRVCKLIDLGIASRLERSLSLVGEPHAFEGTLTHLAPEQTGRIGRPVDRRSDLYALGVTLYQLFAGRLPFQLAKPAEIVHFHLAGTPEPLCDVTTAVPGSVADVVMKLLNKSPEERYWSAAGVVADLERCQLQIDTGKGEHRFPLARHDVRDTPFISPELYGRDKERAVLVQAYERVAAGGVEVVVISGRSGIGKSCLAAELRQRVGAEAGRFVAGKYDQLQREAAYSALSQALAGLVAQLLSEADDVLEKWRARIAERVGPNAHLLTDIIPGLAWVLGPRPPILARETEEARNRFQTAFRRLIGAFHGPGQPLVLFIDDMQWADTASLELLTVLLSERAGGLLLVAACRDTELDSAHPFMRLLDRQRLQGLPVHSLVLQPLGSDDVAHFLADSMGRQPEDVSDLALVVTQKTNGNPFFVRQFLQHLVDERLVFFDSKTNGFGYDVKQINDASITENVADLLAAAIKKLPAEARDVIARAAAVGSWFTVSALAAICRRPKEAISSVLAQAMAARLVQPARGTPTVSPADDEQTYGFCHDRVQQAAYELIAMSERDAVHLEIGRLLRATYGREVPEEALAEIVTHMNVGRALLDVSEAIELARLNLCAGLRAFAAAHTISPRGPFRLRSNCLS